ncbi:MAG: periplasmic heavy metal sensor [Acidobacteria bacterium]|nr:periplasmic heavy metal sensor [Acidobacteriota bacterium]MBI3473983.1 periplasmic heavy metal sensor [Candidatus Solibacter usitatus]
MKKLNGWVLAAALWSLPAVYGEPQAPGMYPWWDSPVARDLNLSEEQNRQVKEAVRGSRGRIIQLRATLEVAEADLKDLMNDDPVDARKAGEAIEKVVAARAEMGRAVAQMSLKLRQILTAKQWQELERRQPRPPMPPVPPAPAVAPRPHAAPVPPAPAAPHVAPVPPPPPPPRAEA